MDENITLDRLCDHAGLERSFWDVSGQLHQVPVGTKKRLLAAMGYAANDPATAEATLKRLERQKEQRLLAPVIVLRDGDAPAITLHMPVSDLEPGLDWQIALETGETLKGRAGADDFSSQSRFISAGEDYISVGLSLPEELPHGYHQLQLQTKTRHDSTRLIIVPRRAYLREDVARSGVWGLAHQLYSLRGSSDWGMGHFSDLEGLCDQIAKAGGDAAGVNPLHALFASNPNSASPYSPSSRLFLSPLYIDVETIPEFGQLDAKHRDDLTARRKQAASGDSVNYRLVWPLKMDVLGALFDLFEEADDQSARQAEFQAFVDQSGAPLERFALYQALEVHFGGSSPNWPESYQDPDSGQVTAFAKSHAGEIRFHGFLQWLAHSQLSQVSDHCAAKGMRIGLYGDLAVGADSAGAEIWSNPQLYVKDVSFGAPPDPLAQQGQNWGLPPFHPVRLREAGYQPFIDILRASMRYCGAIRIDHVMWIQRMFWIPAGAETSEGAYMRFPLDDLLAVIALESHRNQCCVIGEDLGTVPEGFREKMEDHGLLCYRLMRFERYDSGLFKRPDTYPPLALASFGSHDLPPLAGFWDGSDLTMLHGLDLLEGEDGLAREKAVRRTDRQQLFDALADQGLLPPEALEAGADGLEIAALIEAVHGFIARTSSFMAMISLEDVLASPRQINVPGTYLEHPNWRLRAQQTGLSDALDYLAGMMGSRSRS